MITYRTSAAALLTLAAAAALAQPATFDWRTLQQAQKEAPEIRTLCLSSPRTLAHTADGGPSPWLAGFDADQHGGSVPRAVQAAGGKLWAPNRGCGRGPGRVAGPRRPHGSCVTAAFPG